MNPVDELYDLLRTADYQGNVTDEDCLDRADALIAAGWRLVPEGSIVVSREDAQMVVYSSQVSVRHFAEARARIIADLKADGIEQEDGDATIIRAEQQEG